MTPTTVSGVCARIFTAMGRRVSDAELAVWAEALEDIPDNLGAIETAKQVVREHDGKAPITPAVYRKALLAWRARRAAAQFEIEEAHTSTPEVAGRWMAVLRQRVSDIGDGPNGHHDHDAEAWEQCAECKRVARAVAMGEDPYEQETA